MTYTKYGPFSILVPQGHFEQTSLPSGARGRTRIEDAPRSVPVTVEIDVMEIARSMGRKAAKSTGRKATALSGLVVVRNTGAK